MIGRLSATARAELATLRRAHASALSSSDLGACREIDRQRRLARSEHWDRFREDTGTEWPSAKESSL